MATSPLHCHWITATCPQQSFVQDEMSCWGRQEAQTLIVWTAQRALAPFSDQKLQTIFTNTDSLNCPTPQRAMAPSSDQKLQTVFTSSKKRSAHWNNHPRKNVAYKYDNGHTNDLQTDHQRPLLPLNIALADLNWIVFLLFFSCPGQLNKWHCRSVCRSEPTNNQSQQSLQSLQRQRFRFRLRAI